MELATRTIERQAVMYIKTTKAKKHFVMLDHGIEGMTHQSLTVGWSTKREAEQSMQRLAAEYGFDLA